MNTAVSVIITTRNEEKNIEACLNSIKRQSYNDIEIIVIDNNSTDATKSIAKRYTAKFFDKGPERSAQRNFGAGKATGTYLLFLDADMELTPRVIKECVMISEEKRKLAVVIPEESFGVGFWATCKALERSFYLKVDYIEAARFFRKDIFEALEGYDESITGPEDYDLPQRVKELHGDQSIGRVSAHIRHNEGKLSLIGTMRKKYYYGKKMDRYKAKKENSQYLIKQASILNRYIIFFSNPLKLFRDPVVGLGMLFMKTSEMVAIACGYVSAILV
ncbi:MAG TPA: glycosyltransferase [Patescibacteria group bacterium]|nr:glycosyltransferase [Patescibacteria group bacterium]